MLCEPEGLKNSYVASRESLSLKNITVSWLQLYEKRTINPGLILKT